MRTGSRGRWAAGAALAVALALAALYLGSRGRDGPADASRETLAEALSRAGGELLEGRAAPAQEPAIDAPRPGSMQASLLESTEANRAHLFWRAIVDAGFECPEVRAAGAVGTTGSNWRANCGDASVYLIEVGEFGRLSVSPMPYGDLQPERVPRRVPAEEGSTLQLRVPE